MEESWSVWGRAQALRVRGMEHSPANTGTVILVIDREFGLAKVHWAGKPIVQDFSGAQGQADYQSLKHELAVYYGAPIELTEQARMKTDGRELSFYACLQDTECGQWRVRWITPQSTIVTLELIGFAAGAGFLQVTYEGPNIAVIIERLHQTRTPQHDI